MNTEEIHLRDYLRVISKRRALVAAFFVVTLVVVIIATLSATPQYRGMTMVMIEKESSNSISGRYDGYRFYDPEFYETQFQLIRSHAVARRIVRNLKLDRDDSMYMSIAKESSGGPLSWIGSLRGALSSLLPKSKSEVEAQKVEVSLVDTIASGIAAGITISPVKNSRIVAISYDSPNPEFAALIANTTARAYMEENLEMNMESTRRNLEWMTRKADEERGKLEQKELDLQRYMRSNDLITLEDRLAVIPQKLAEISTQLVKAESHRKELESLYHKVRTASADTASAESILAVTEGRTLQTLRDQILKAEQYVMELSGKYGPKHPAMIKARNDLNILSQKKQEEVSRLTDGVKNEYELALANENNLRSQLDRTKAEALNLNEKYIQYGVLKREMETNRQLYDALVLKMKEQSITGETEQVNMWIVEKAQVPLRPVKPRKAVNILLGLVVGLFGGVGLAFFVEYLDNTVKYPEETEKALGISVLGLVSLWKDQGKKLEQVLLEQPRSTYAENYRALRTAVMLSSAEGAPKKLLVTSPGASAGKTTTAANLAVALAQTEKRVVLIDGDMRKPRQHKVFAKTNKNGLSNYLAGGSGENLLQKGPVDNMAIITAGPIPPNPAELLSSARMQKLLEGLEKDFDVIICDSPPLLTVADARILSRLFDGTMLVIRARQTTFDMAGRAVKSLTDVNAPILGMVINALELKKSDYYYQYYYSSYYGDEPEAQTPTS